MGRADGRDRHHERIAEARAGRHAERIGYPIRIRTTEVLRTTTVGSGLVRVTLGGPGTSGFEAHAADEHVKLFFPEEDGQFRLPEQDDYMLRWPEPHPTTREYTVRRYDPETGELDIDIALHGKGIASDWAQVTKPGDVMHVAGPPGGVIVPHDYDRYVLAGDLTALPAIARWLEELPRTARGWAFIEVRDASEEIELSAPEDVDVVWLHRDDWPVEAGDLMAKAVLELDVPRDERIYVWLAGEAGALKPLRRWVRDDLGLAKGDYDITGYWKRGIAHYDDDHDHH